MRAVDTAPQLPHAGNAFALGARVAPPIKVRPSAPNRRRNIGFCIGKSFWTSSRISTTRHIRLHQIRTVSQRTGSQRLFGGSDLLWNQILGSVGIRHHPICTYSFTPSCSDGRPNAALLQNRLAEQSDLG